MINKVTASKMLSAHKLVTDDGVEHVQFCFKDVCIMCIQNEAIQRVRELHKPQETMVKPYEVKLICKWCSNDPKYVVYPCPTIKALDGEQ